MRPLNGVVTRQKHLYDLVIVVLGGEYQRRYVRRKLTFFLGTEERIVLWSRTLDALLSRHVVRMLDDHFHDLRRTLQSHLTYCFFQINTCTNIVHFSDVFDVQ